MDTQISHAALLKLKPETREKEIRLLLKIFGNVLNEPNNKKYQNLNQKTLYQRLDNYDILIKLVFSAGFYMDRNERVVFDTSKMDELQTTNNFLLKFVSQKTISNKPLPQKTMPNKVLSQNSISNNPSSTQQLMDMKYNEYKKAALQPQQQDIRINCHIENCESVKRLMEILKIYDVNISTEITDDGIKYVINDFLHLLVDHSTDEEFEYIYNKFDKYCNHQKCERFRRIHEKTKNNENEVKLFDFKCQIIDKIHCFYRHAFDIGNKLHSTEKSKIISNTNDMKSHDDDDDLDKYLLSQDILNTRAVLLNKRKENQNTMPVYTKYNQLLIHQNEMKNNNYSMYNFGLKFVYGYEGEYKGPEDDYEEEIDSKFGKKSFINVSKKYSSLKQEVTQNEIAILTVEQFHNEYQKAQTHFASNYCKQTFTSRTIDDIEYIFSIEYLLSLMIYCNYTRLQYLWSKTYREKHGKDHDNFYFLSKYLKMVIKSFGTKVGDGYISSLFHGVGERLLFPQYFFGDGTSEVMIHCPLSTTSSFTVATNFTNKNGLVVAFSDNGIVGFSPKYFSCAWLSDYGNEREYLFVQNNEFQESLKISNIFDIKIGHDFEAIFKALDTITHIMQRGGVGLQIDVELTIEELILMILHDILSSSSLESANTYRTFNTLAEYAKNIIKSYCNAVMQTTINYLDISTPKYQFMFNLFWQSANQWMDFKILHALFPNILQIITSNVNLNSKTMEFIAEHLKYEPNMQVILLAKISKQSALTPDEAALQYKQQYENIGFRITPNVFPNSIHVSAISFNE